MNTITVDSSLYRGAETYARLHNISVSELVESFFRRFLVEKPVEAASMSQAEFFAMLAEAVADIKAGRGQKMQSGETLSAFMDRMELEGHV